MLQTRWGRPGVGEPLLSSRNNVCGCVYILLGRRTPHYTCARRLYCLTSGLWGLRTMLQTRWGRAGVGESLLSSRNNVCGCVYILLGRRTPHYTCARRLYCLTSGLWGLRTMLQTRWGRAGVGESLLSSRNNVCGCVYILLGRRTPHYTCARRLYCLTSGLWGLRTMLQTRWGRAGVGESLLSSRNNVCGCVYILLGRRTPHYTCARRLYCLTSGLWGLRTMLQTRWGRAGVGESLLSSRNNVCGCVYILLGRRTPHYTCARRLYCLTSGLWGLRTMLQTRWGRPGVGESLLSSRNNVCGCVYILLGRRTPHY